MFGWHSRLAVDAFLGINNSQKQIKSQKNFAQKVQRRLNFAQRVAGGNITKNTGRSQQNYDQKVRFEKLEVGNRVLVRKLVFSGRSKLTDKGERDPYIVIKQSVSDIPVYGVGNRVLIRLKHCIERARTTNGKIGPVDLP